MIYNYRLTLLFVTSTNKRMYVLPQTPSTYIAWHKETLSLLLLDRGEYQLTWTTKRFLIWAELHLMVVCHCCDSYSLTQR